MTLLGISIDFHHHNGDLGKLLQCECMNSYICNSKSIFLEYNCTKLLIIEVGMHHTQTAFKSREILTLSIIRGNELETAGVCFFSNHRQEEEQNEKKYTWRDYDGQSDKTNCTVSPSPSLKKAKLQQQGILSGMKMTTC